MAESNDVIGVELRAIVDQFTGKLQEAFGVASHSVKDFAKTLEEVKSHTKGHSEDMKSAFGLIGEAVETFGGIFTGVLATIAGGAIFKEFVEEAIRATNEVDKLNRVYGLTADQTMTLDLATKMVGSSTEAMTGGMNRLARQLTHNEAQINSLGVKTRDGNGNFLDTLTILTSTGSALEKYGAGMGRLEVATKLFGRNVELVNAVMRMTPEVMKEAEEFHKSLNVTIGQGGVKAFYDYQAASAKATEVVSKGSTVIGQALLPALTSVADGVAGMGPGIINLFKMLADVVGFVSTGIIQLGTVANGIFAAIGFELLTLNDVIMDIAHGQGQKAWADFIAGEEAVGARTREVWETLKKEGQAYLDMRKRMWDGDTELPDQTGGKPPDLGKHKDRTPEFEKAMKYIESTTQDTFKSMDRFEMEFWENLLQNAELTTAEFWSVTDKFFAAKKKLATEDVALALAQQGEQTALHKDSLELQYADARGHYQLMAALYGADDKRAADAHVKAIEAERKLFEQKRKFAEDDITNAVAHKNRVIDAQKGTLDQQLSLGMINSVEKLQLERNSENESYINEMNGYKAKLALAQGHAEEVRKIKNDMLTLEDQHQKKLIDLSYQEADAIKQNWLTILGPIGSAFSTSITGVILGTQTLRKAMANIFQSILGSFVDMGVQMLIKYTAQQMGIRALNEIMAARKISSDLAVAAIGGEAGAVQARLNLASFAASGAVAAGASVAAIPGWGWAAAPEVMADAYTEFMSMEAAIPAAAKGMIVPQDMLAMVHKDEMVLPATLTKGLRKIAESPTLAQATQSAPSNTTTTLQVNMPASDTRSLEQIASSHKTFMAEQLKPTVNEIRLPSVVQSMPKLSDVRAPQQLQPAPKANDIRLPPVAQSIPKTSEVRAAQQVQFAPKANEIRLPSVAQSMPKANDVRAPQQTQFVPRANEIRLPTVAQSMPKMSDISASQQLSMTKEIASTKNMLSMVRKENVAPPPDLRQPANVPTAPDNSPSAGQVPATGSSPDLHIHLQTNDARSFQQMLLDESSIIYKAWKSHVRTTGRMLS